MAVLKTIILKQAGAKVMLGYDGVQVESGNKQMTLKEWIASSETNASELSAALTQLRTDVSAVDASQDVLIAGLQSALADFIAADESTDASQNLAIAANAADILTLKTWQANAVDPSLGSHEDRVTTIEAWKPVVDASLVSHETRVNAVETWRPDVDAFVADLSTRAAATDAAIAAIVSGADTKNSSVDASLVSHETRVKTLEDWRPTVDASVTDLSAAVDALATQADETHATIRYEVSTAVKDAVASIVTDAPEAFDTLGEIAKWINDDSTGTAALISHVDSIDASVADLSTRVKTTEAGVKALEDWKLDAAAAVADLSARMPAVEGRAKALEDWKSDFVDADTTKKDDIDASIINQKALIEDLSTRLAEALTTIANLTADYATKAALYDVSVIANGASAAVADLSTTVHNTYVYGEDAGIEVEIEEPAQA